MRIGEHGEAADGRNVGRRHQRARAEIDGLLDRRIDVRRRDVAEPVRRTGAVGSSFITPPSGAPSLVHIVYVAAPATALVPQPVTA